MIICTSKAKHFWKNGESATWIKSDHFKKNAFEKLKEEYENLKYSRKNYIQIEGKTLFLFYQSKKDFADRSITEITALQMDKKVNDLDRTFQSIKNQINNPFDDTLEYELEIDNSLIDKRIDWKIYTMVLTLVFIAILYFTLTQKENPEPPIRELPIPTTIENNKSTETISSRELENATEENITKIEEPMKWKWEEFCKKNRVKSPIYCYQGFINKKCDYKENFSQGYIDFVNQDVNNPLCIDFIGIEDMGSDSDLKNKEFRYNEKAFFEGEE